jgi:1-deoxy-D-xylulose-5-phosphate reductoisomerase
MPTVLDAASEAAVDAFMAGRIAFYGISEIVGAVCTTLSGRQWRSPFCLDEAPTFDQGVRSPERQLAGQPR